MKNLIVALVGMALVSACSKADDRPPVDENLTRPLEVARIDTSQPLEPIEHQVTKPAEPTPTPARQKPKPQPRKAVGPGPVVAAAAPQEDTSSVQAYAPGPVPDSAPAADSAPGPVSDTIRRPALDTSTAPVPDSEASTVPDTASTAVGDTMVGRDSSPEVRLPPTASVTAARTLPIGTEIHAALDDSINSRTDTVGRVVTAVVMENVTGSDGRALIPAGAPVRFTVTRLSAAKSKSAQGRLKLRVDGIGLGGELQRLSAAVRPIPHELRGRGVTAGDAAKVGVGAAGGAVLGKVIGKNTKGAVIGGVIGAAGGAVVASQTASRDVVVKARTPVVFVLTEPLVAP